MKKTLHKVTHYYQPTNNTCGYAALAIFLSHYGRQFKPEELMGKVPQPKDAEGTSHGSVTAQLADWIQEQGLQVHMYVSDMYITDLSWKNKTSEQIKKRLEQVKSKRKVLIMDSHWVGVYEDAYLSMLSHGADLSVVQFITTDLLYKLLESGPVYANICSSASGGKGRTLSPELRTTVPDDINGSIVTHSVVIYGNDEGGNFLVADPWDGLMKTKPEHMILAIAAAQVECDNQIFVIV
jgi:hypothetical protein